MLSHGGLNCQINNRMELSRTQVRACSVLSCTPASGLWENGALPAHAQPPHRRWLGQSELQWPTPPQRKHWSCDLPLPAQACPTVRMVLMGCSCQSNPALQQGRSAGARQDLVRGRHAMQKTEQGAGCCTVFAGSSSRRAHALQALPAVGVSRGIWPPALQNMEAGFRAHLPQSGRLGLPCQQPCQRPSLR